MAKTIKTLSAHSSTDGGGQNADCRIGGVWDDIQIPISLCSTIILCGQEGWRTEDVH